jgi:hypothetical protein
VASTNGRREDVGKGIRDLMWSKYCVHIYANAKHKTSGNYSKNGREPGGNKNDGIGKFKHVIYDIL